MIETKKPLSIDRNIIIATGFVVFLVFAIAISVQFYLYYDLSEMTETRIENLRLEIRDLDTQARAQDEMIILKLDQTAGHIIGQLEEQQKLNEEQRLELEKKTLQNFKNLEGYIEQKTSTLKVDFVAQLSDVDKQIKGLEAKDYEIEDKVDSIKVQSSDFTGIVQDVIEAVVSIKTDTGQGSGFFFNKNGYIMTNKHVIDGAGNIFAIDYNSKVYPARIVATAKNVDLAVLKVEEEKDFKYLRFESEPRVGQRVIAVGNPLGLSFTVTEGIISAIDRRIDNSGVGYVQTDVPINKGSSGGPLVNSAKRVVGVNTVKLSAGEGLGFAIPSDIAEEFAQLAIENNR